jgi:5-methylcytosine-specific restriction endonuclease McrA
MVERSTAVRDRHRAIIARGHPPCWICGRPIRYDLPYPEPESFVVDHKTPLNRGGTDTLDNKAAAHQRCNRAKSDRLDGGPVLKRSGSLAF